MIEPNDNELPGHTNAANGQTRNTRASQRFEVCYGLFSKAYQCACKFADGQSPCEITFREFENTAEVYEETAQ